jgi:hypothetical protein
VKCPSKPRLRRFLSAGVMYTEAENPHRARPMEGQYITVWVTRPEQQHPFWGYFLPEEEIKS